MLVLAAHPDDETIGASTELGRLHRTASVAFATDGAVRTAPSEARQAIAAQRRTEALAVANALGVPRNQVLWLGIADQDASYRLPELTAALRRLVAELSPDVLLTHPYEGGHPDHDACAFAAQQALEGLGSHRCVRLEMASYHDDGGCLRTGAFLPHPAPSPPTCTVRLLPPELQRKRALFGLYASQAEVLRYFDSPVETFRVAPRYDFRQPPHPGTLYYERFSWGVTGGVWRALAAAALAPPRPPEGCG